MRRKASDIIIIGGGGHGLSALDALQSKGLDCSANVTCFDDAGGYSLVGRAGFNTISPLNRVLDLELGPEAVYVAFGDNLTRKKWVESLSSRGWELPPLVHASAYVSASAVLAGSVFVGGGAFIGPNCHIGDGVIINTNCSVDHNCSIGAFSHVAPGVTLAGGVTVGIEAFVGLNSSVVEQIVIPDRAFVRAHSLVKC